MDALTLSQTLIRMPSMTPDDSDCLPYLARLLGQAGFDIRWLDFGEAGTLGDGARVRNLLATHGHPAPTLCFVGHTDVVPVGDVNAWTHPPFDGVITGDMLHGRGASDMKTGVAAFVCAAIEFVKAHPDHKGRLCILLTGDEEGTGVHGIKKVASILTDEGFEIDYCLVGEPSSSKTLGDVIKNGRRGSLGGRLVVTGKQGHVAYPKFATNPIHLLTGALSALQAHTWDTGNAYFDPTSLQVSNIHAGTGATNVIPKTAEAMFNLRYSPETTKDAICSTVAEILDATLDGHDASYTLDWVHSGAPFLTDVADEAGARFLGAITTAVEKICNTRPALSTSGGTSDGRFIAPMGAKVVELGVCNATIHQIDERILAHDVLRLKDIYQEIINTLLG